ncbi:ATP-grasp domain-containing protein [bacterium]|nr:ATP-grasp domain-containing protein [bacterium]
MLVANRGEIALRIIRAGWELGIHSVLAASEADIDSLPARVADQVVSLGGGGAGETYLSLERIIEAAKESEVQAIHPGYGFLSENPTFSRRCEEEDLIFIGPSADAMEKLGDKVWAKKKAEELKIPIIPGSKDVVKDAREAFQIAKRVGYPVLIKAAAGGGGRGMRVVQHPRDLKNAFLSAQQEATLAFGDDACFLEKYLAKPRHVEIQMMADTRGQVRHLFERECSIQRRHQKLLEEAPCLKVSHLLRRSMIQASIGLVRAAKYYGVCTMEFLVDRNRAYFIECNTRVQVEHPVTEQITGIDIVRAGIRIAGREKIPFSQHQVKRQGHAIECRINAEDPRRGFAPTPGRVEELILPAGPGIRVDTHLCPGYTVPDLYDSLVAKVIAFGRTRKEAINRMERALREMVIRGFPTTLPFHRRLLAHQTFRRGKSWTRFVEQQGSRLTEPDDLESERGLMAAALLLADEEDHPPVGKPIPEDQGASWALGGTPEQQDAPWN